MQAIWKFKLEATDWQEVNMPVDAKILCVQAQNECPCLWALIPSTSDTCPKQTRYITIYGTGHQHDEIPGTYIGTFQLMGGQLVFHAFEIEPYMKPKTPARKIHWED